MLNSLQSQYQIQFLIMIMVITFILTAAIYVPLHTQAHELGHKFAIELSARSLGYVLKHKIQISNKYFRGYTSSDLYAYLSLNKCDIAYHPEIKRNAISGLIATIFMQAAIIISLPLVVLPFNLDYLALLTVFTYAISTILLFALLTAHFFLMSNDWKYYMHPCLFEYAYLK